MWKFLKELFFPTLEDEVKTKSFNNQLCDAVDRAEKARQSILHSDMRLFERMEIADEMLYLIDDLRELQTTRDAETKRLWEYFHIHNTGQLGLF